MTDADNIVAGLSEAQKMALLEARQHVSGPANILLRIYRDAGRMARSLVALGLCEFVGLGTRLTPTSLAVRAKLEDDNG